MGQSTNDHNRAFLDGNCFCRAAFISSVPRLNDGVHLYLFAANNRKIQALIRLGINGQEFVIGLTVISGIGTFSAGLLSWNLVEKQCLVLKRHFQ
jgi:hypothetical protein